MTPLFKKLNLKDQSLLLIVNNPPEFEPELKLLKESSPVDVHSKPEKIDYPFIMVFAKDSKELEQSLNEIAFKSAGDPVIWMVYPKKTSKKYQSDLNRDCDWASLKSQDLDTVRMVSVDQDWSALRFRFKQFIKR